MSARVTVDAPFVRDEANLGGGHFRRISRCPVCCFYCFTAHSDDAASQPRAGEHRAAELLSAISTFEKNCINWFSHSWQPVQEHPATAAGGKPVFT